MSDKIQTNKSKKLSRWERLYNDYIMNRGIGNYTEDDKERYLKLLISARDNPETMDKHLRKNKKSKPKPKRCKK